MTENPSALAVSGVNRGGVGGAKGLSLPAAFASLVQGLGEFEHELEQHARP